MSSINPNLSLQSPRNTPSVSALVEGILAGNRVLLSQAITLIESTRTDHQSVAQAVIEKCMPHAGRSLRIGITGTPGVGKSTFIEVLGEKITQFGQIAVLAIDPSSQLTKGSILGDKTRMTRLSNNPKAFIRPSAAGNSLGGVAQKTRETIILCEAAGFDFVIVETVGVGQSETAVRQLTDFFLLLLLPGAGDDLQGIKRGIVEMADLIAVNKADGDRELLAQQAQAFYRHALHFFPSKDSAWQPQVLTCSAFSGLNLDSIWQLILDYQQFTKGNDFFHKNRQAQAVYWLRETVAQNLTKKFYTTPLPNGQTGTIATAFSDLEKQIISGTINPFQAAQILLDLFFEEKNR